MIATDPDIAPVWDGDVVEIFAGPGGWSEGLRELGVTGAVGYEWDKEACATAEAAGHARIRADVSMVDLGPLSMLARRLLLIGSPPCQSFSNAGRQKGKLDKPRIVAHVARIRAAGRWLHYSREGWHDDRSPLVLEPLRWALVLHPDAIALEQVPQVLPLFEAFAEVLRDHGYHVDTGVLSSEQYGVPQTRKRAFLIARRCEWHESDRFYTPDGRADLERMAGLECPRRVALPAPTHRPYRKGVAQAEGDVTLLPWVSMAEALGWREGDLVGFPRRPDTCAGHVPPGAPPCPKHATDDLIEIDGVDYKRRDLRLAGEPAKTLTEHVRSWQLRQSAQANATVRREDEPAPTITAGHDRAERVWEPAEEAEAMRMSASVQRAVDEPSATVTGGNRGSGYWLPTGMAQAGNTSTMVDPRPVETPSGTITGKGTAAWHPRPSSGAVRVSVPEAAVLQSVRPDYPFQGSRTAQYRQVGDLVPPRLAAAVLAAVIGAR